jgi:hypothetical protein
MVKISFMNIDRFRGELLVQQNVSTPNQAASQLKRVVQFEMSERKVEVHRRDAETAEA